MNNQETSPPEARLVQGIFGFMLSKAISVAAELDIADKLADGPRYYTDLAAAIEVDQRALHRVLRLLSAAGIFAETGPGTFALNEVSDLLRSDHPTSLRDFAVMATSESHWLPWGRLAATVRSGVSGPRHAFGTDIFSWLQRKENRRQWEIFNAAMTSFSLGAAMLVGEVYDFSRCRRIVDVGGGHGLLLSRVLEAAPEATGVLFDLPGVVEAARDLDPRIERVGGNFFESVPAGGDIYLLKFIIHDWSDDQCVQILRNITAAMAPEGRVLVIETVMPETPGPHPAKFMDVNMLAMTEGGCERTESEYRELFARSGLRLEKIEPTKGTVSVIQAVLP